MFWLNKRFSSACGTGGIGRNLLILAGNLSKTGLFLSIPANNLRIQGDNLLILGFIPSLTINIQTVYGMI